MTRAESRRPRHVGAWLSSNLGGWQGIILVVALFYYAGRGWMPDIIRSATLFPALAVMAVFGVATHQKRGVATPSRTAIAVSVLALAVLVLVLIAGAVGGREASVVALIPLYFLAPLAAIAYYFWISRSPLPLFQVARAAVWILSIEAAIEWLMINTGTGTFLLPHYTLSELDSAYIPGYEVHAARGLLDNHAVTGSALVALIWFCVAFRPADSPSLRKEWAAAGLGLLATASGTAFILALITLGFYFRQRWRWMLGAVLIAQVLSVTVPYFKKFGVAYILEVGEVKRVGLTSLASTILDRPLTLLLGTDAVIPAASADFAITKAITDLGIGALLIPALVVAVALRSARSAIENTSQRNAFYLAVFALVGGSFHYGVLFAAPVSLMFGAITAWALRAAELDPNPPSPGA